MGAISGLTGSRTFLWTPSRQQVLKCGQWKRNGTTCRSSCPLLVRSLYRERWSHCCCYSPRTRKWTISWRNERIENYFFFCEFEEQWLWRHWQVLVYFGSKNIDIRSMPLLQLFDLVGTYFFKRFKRCMVLHE